MATNTFSTFSRENLLTAARQTVNNDIVPVAEVLNEVNDMIADAHVEQGNGLVSHTVSRRTALPTPTWTVAGNGWNATTALVQQATEEIAILHDRAQFPEDVIRIQPNPGRYRSQQERPHIEAIGQTVANQLIYGGFDQTAGTLTPAPERFNGFASRYQNLSTEADILSGAANPTYVIDNGDSGASNDTSAWFIQWGPGLVYLIYPRNSNQVGLFKKDEGRQLVSGDNAVASTTATFQNPTNQLWALITEFGWDVGLCIEDGRSVKRLANIDSVKGTANTIDEDNIIQILNNFKTMGTIFIYVNEQVFTQLRIRAKDKQNVWHDMNSPFGKNQLMFDASPIRRSDAILNDEISLT
jgi:hypothetical protein